MRKRPFKRRYSRGSTGSLVRGMASVGFERTPPKNIQRTNVTRKRPVLVDITNRTREDDGDNHPKKKQKSEPATCSTYQETSSGGPKRSRRASSSGWTSSSSSYATPREDDGGRQPKKRQKSDPATGSTYQVTSSGKGPRRMSSGWKSSSSSYSTPSRRQKCDAKKVTVSRAPSSRSSVTTSNQGTSLSLPDASTVVRDIDDEVQQSKDPTKYDKAYVKDVFARHRQDEVKFRALPAYIPNPQNDINTEMRSILIDWLIGVAEELDLCSQQALYISVNLIDRSLMKCRVPRNGLQLVGCACLLIASKYADDHSISVDELVTMSENMYTRHQIIDKEVQVLTTLSFQLCGATSHVFLDRFLCASRSGLREQSLARYLSELSLLNYRPMMNYLPSMIAAGCIHLSRQMLGMSVIWDATMAHYSGYESHQLIKVVHDLRDLWQRGPPKNLQRVKNKYAHERFYEVSCLRPPPRHSLRFYNSS